MRYLLIDIVINITFLSDYLMSRLKTEETRNNYYKNLPNTISTLLIYLNYYNAY